MPPGRVARSVRGATRPRRRIRLDNDQRRAQLLELAKRAFSDRSYDEVSIDDLARKAGISKGLLYHYFPTKRAFYVAAISEAARVLVERTETDPSRPPIERLREGLDVFHAYVARHGSKYAAILRGGVGSDRDVFDIIDGARELFIRRIIEGLGLGEPSPLLHGALRGWIGFLEVTVLDWLEKRRIDRIALRELQLEVLLAAIRAAVGAAPDET